jgi:hypothetical protein
MQKIRPGEQMSTPKIPFVKQIKPMVEPGFKTGENSGTLDKTGK